MTPLEGDRRRPISALTFLVILAGASVVGSLLGLAISRWRDGGDGPSTTTLAPAADLPTDPEALWLFGSTTLRIDPDDLTDPRAVPVEVFGGVAGDAGTVDLYSPFTGDFGVLDATDNTLEARSNVPPVGEVDPEVVPVLAPTADAVWVVTGPGSVAAIARDSGDELERFELPSSFTGLADGTEVTSTRLVATSEAAVAVFEVTVTGGGSAVGLARLALGSDPVFGTLDARPPEPVAAVAAGRDAVWVVQGVELVRIDARMLRETGRVDLGAVLGRTVRIEAGVVGEGALWLLEREEPSLVRVADALEVTGATPLAPDLELGGAPAAITAGGGSVFVLLPRVDGSTVLVVVDGTSGAVRERLGFPRETLLAALAFSKDGAGGQQVVTNRRSNGSPT